MSKYCRLFLSLLTIFLLGLSLPADASPPLSLAIAHEIRIHTMTRISDVAQTTAAPAQTSEASSDAKSEDSDEPATEQQETIGIHALNILLNDFDLLRGKCKDVATNFAVGPDMANWLEQQTDDTRRLDRWKAIGQDIPIVIGVPFLIAALLDLVFIPLRRVLQRRKPDHAGRKAIIVLAMACTKLIPVIVFIGTSLTLLGHYETQKLPRLVILSIIYALTLNRLALSLIRIVLMPKSESLRLIPISDEQATNAWRWLTMFSMVIIYGYFLADFARAVHIPLSAISTLNHSLGLLLITMAIALISQKRSVIAGILRGPLSVAQPDLSAWQGSRLWFARHWHILAITYLVIGYGITLLDVQNGFNLMLRGTILTLLILAILRFFLLAMEHKARPAHKERPPVHRLFLIFVACCIAWVFATLAIAAAWGVNLQSVFATTLGQRFLGASLSIGVTIVLTSIIYEILHTTSERQLNRRDTEGKPIPASARMRTLLPMLRNTMLIVFATVIGLVSLSEAGINIGPLLAGAGVLGVAVGFGSQTLVKDFLTGLFIVLENTIAIGDVVKIGDHSGVVEAMSLRTLRIRDGDGALHILAFSEVSPIINMTKDFAFAVIDVGVAYNCDLEHVMAVLRLIGEELQQDPIFKRVIVEPIEVLGIEKLGDSSITVRSRLRTRPGKQWDVKRMFLLKMKQRFDKEGIEIPYPTVAQITKA